MSELAQGLLGLLLGLCLIPFAVFLCCWRFRPRWRLITVAVPVDSNPQPVRDRLYDAIRAYRYQESAAGEPTVFTARPWTRWLFGAADISIAPVATALMVTCPAEFYGAIRRIVPNATARPYAGREPLWPVVRGGLRLSAILVACVLVLGVVAYVVDVAVGLD